MHIVVDGSLIPPLMPSRTEAAPVAYEVAVLQAEVLQLPQAAANAGCACVTYALAAPHIQVH